VLNVISAIKMKIFQVVLLLIFLAGYAKGFTNRVVRPFSSPSPQSFRDRTRQNLSMKWMFSKGAGPLPEVGGLGGQGEYYFVPSKKPTLKAPAGVLGSERTIPIFPRNQVLSPSGEEYIGVYEMRYRQLLNDIGSGGVFGHVYYSPENSKLAMVGTLARIKKTERLDDGGIYVLLEGIGKFYLRDIVSEKPYLKAKVQMFNDWTENEALLESLEQNVLKEVRVSVKVMKLLYPQNNYTMNQSVLKYRPPLSTSGVRLVQLPGSDTELQRRSKFSFATMDMLKTDPVTKLLFLQEPVLERRYKNMLRVLEESTAFLEGELRKRGVVTDVGIAKLREEALNDLSDLAPPQSQESQQLIRDQDNFFPIEL
jgi:hypothetical protein